MLAAGKEDLTVSSDGLIWLWRDREAQTQDEPSDARDTIKEWQSDEMV